ncbi:MBL fold metallo-hydrolase [Paenibacillus tarimensis]
MRITFLGTGDAMGVPRVYCDCRVCEEARNEGGNRRLRSTVLLQDEETGSAFIDCGPDWGRQMELAGLRSIHRMLITHAHFDHIGGLVEWADACRWLGIKGDAYAPRTVIQQIISSFPWLPNHINFIETDEGIRIGKWNVRSWRVNHGKNGYSFAYRFDHQSGNSAWAYCSDAISLTEEQMAPLYDLDLLILGTSFYKEPFPIETRSVYDVTEALSLIVELRPKQTVFTHLSHDIDIRRNYDLPQHVSLAVTGMSLSV